MKTLLKSQMKWLREFGLLLKCFYLSRWGSLDVAVINMIHLNIYARNKDQRGYLRRKVRFSPVGKVQ